MKTTTTKLSVLAFLGLGLAVYGQSGKVGINISSPRATLDVQPNATNSEDDAKTNEGILAPKLSKIRVASIEAPVEGTLVYVIDDVTKVNGTINAYTGVDPKVAKITEKGYYYYNGTEWVKSAAGNLDQEWVYDATTNRINLKRSGTTPFENEVYFDQKGNFVSKDRDSFELYNGTNVSTYTPSLVAKENYIINASKLDRSEYFAFPGLYNKMLYSRYFIVDADDVGGVADSREMNNNRMILERNRTGDYRTLRNGVFSFESYATSGNHRMPIGVWGAVNYRGGANITNIAIALRGENYFNSTGTANMLAGGSNTVQVAQNAGEVSKAYGTHSALSIQNLKVNEGAALNLLSNVGSTEVTKLFGISLKNEVPTTNNVTSNYGLYIYDIRNATNNYAIYTGLGKVRFGDNVGIGVDAPTEKLEVAGTVKATGFTGASGATIFPDYVFQKYYTGTSSLKADYNFKTLSQVEDFVKTNGHLPGYQSAEAIKKQGYIDLMATQLTNVEKIEELYLHLLEKDKEVKALKAEITELKSLVKDLLAK
ncbi:hypothetical protein [Riemerella anatipestifer]|uniref:hypothetical protein n=1 Tax=Riemerella anatipestifer TaxID=34085 RepID=UPI00129D54F2|nr:hypothetical protein [Riemerella anatipestifer]MRM83783.1 hypothetical protein [Riemerella anatipestifer]